MQIEKLIRTFFVCFVLQAHQTMLSACSPYFENIFIQNKHPHPIIYLNDVEYDIFKGIIEYIYKGEVNVAQSLLPKFLKTAEGLKVITIMKFVYPFEFEFIANEFPFFSPLPNQLKLGFSR